jgi:hypothetical protein
MVYPVAGWISQRGDDPCTAGVAHDKVPLPPATFTVIT